MQDQYWPLDDELEEFDNHKGLLEDATKQKSHPVIFLIKSIHVKASDPWA